MSNRKLIRTTLAEVKGKERIVPQPRERERSNNGSHRGTGGGDRDGGREPGRENARAQQSSVQVRKRTPPPMETNAELFYYKKQIGRASCRERV